VKALALKEKIKLSRTLLTLLDELDEECLETVKLISRLRVEGLTSVQLEDMLGDLSASVTHLRIHATQVEKALEEELDKDIR